MPTTVKTKATQKRLDAAVNSFHARYSSPDQYGEQRWHNDLVPALSRPTSYVALVNDAFVEVEKVLQVFSRAGTADADLRRLAFTTALPHDSLQTHAEGMQRLVCFEHTALQKDHDAGISERSRSEPPFPAPTRIASKDVAGQDLLSHWNLDAASILAASMLQAQPGDRVLDLCSAPGGKSIALSQLLFYHLYDSSARDESEDLSSSILARTSLHCNELDTQRHKRLTANLQAYLPAELFVSKSVCVLKIDGSAKSAVTSFPHGESGYDKVLIDAPCSSERHILHAHAKATQSGQIAEEMLNWKQSHSQTLAKTQVGLLINGLLAVRLGGRVVYATCALGREENDFVIETVLSNIRQERKREKTSDKRKRWDWDLEFAMGEQGLGHDEGVPMLDEMTERTKYGRIALPDRGGWGPLYFCVMTKIQRVRKSKRAHAEHANVASLTDIGDTMSSLQIQDE